MLWQLQICSIKHITPIAVIVVIHIGSVWLRLFQSVPDIYALVKNYIQISIETLSRAIF